MIPRGRRCPVFGICDEAFRADASHASHGVEAIAASGGRLRYGGGRT